MKRFIALLLISVILIGVFSSLAGCSNENINTLTVGQWLVLLNDSFGMNSYIDEQPHVKNIDSSNPFYQTVQTAAEWDVISSDAINVDEPLRWNQTLITLVNASDFTDATATDDEKINFFIKNFDNTIKTYWMKRTIEANKAIELLSKVQTAWADQKYSERKEEVKLKDNVIDLREKKTKLARTEEKILLSNLNTGIKKDDICIVPDEKNPHEVQYIKAEKITVKNNTTVITPSNYEVKPEDVYKKIYIEETLVPTSENTVIYDGNGNIVPMSAATVPQSNNGSKADVVNLVNTTPNDGIINCMSNSHSFNTDGYTVSLGYDIGESLNLSVSISSSNMLKKREKNGHSLKLYTNAEISDLAITHKFDWEKEKDKINPFPILNSAKLKIDYKMKQNGGITYSGKEDFRAAPAYSNGNGKFLTNFKRAVMKKDDGNIYGAKTVASKKQIKVCSLNIYSVGVAKICLDVVASVSVNGSVEITITQSGSNGIEYRNGKIRFIKSNNHDLDIQAKAKVEATIDLGPALYVIGLNKRLIGISAKGGIGASVALKMHLADSQMHLIEEADFTGATPEQAALMAQVGTNIMADSAAIQAVAASQGGIYKVQAGQEVKLHIDWCTDVKAYGIFSIGVMDESYLIDFLKVKSAGLSISIANEKNATFLNMHVDNFNWSNAVYTGFDSGSEDNCTLHYIPFEKGTNEEIDETKIQENKHKITIGENLILSTMNVNMEAGQKYSINVTVLPKGYTIKDVVFSSQNEEIASINDNGVVEALDEGFTAVTAKTKDGKFSAVTAIIVTTKSTVEFKGISGVNV